MNNAIIKSFLLLIWFSCQNQNAFSSDNGGIRYAFDGDEAVVMGLVDFTYSGKINIPYYAKSAKTGKEYRVTRINKGAFNGCHMSEINLPYISKIDDLAFEFCYYLKKISIGAGCRKIGNGVLWGADIAEVDIDIDNIYYDSRNGCNAIIETATNRLIAGSGKTTIPEGVECLAYESFGCLFLETISIPKSVRKIEAYAFNDFYQYFKEIYVAATVPPIIDQYSFDDSIYEHTTLYVPKGYVEKYRNHINWGQFKKIEEYDSTTSIYEIVIDKSNDDEYFDISGRVHKAPIRGLNILKKKDGTTKKIVLKQK